MEKLMCPIKINLTLRVLSRRDDGFHEIISLFWKKKGIEGLTIRPSQDENIGDILDIKGMNIPGENILIKALRLVRTKRPDIPPLLMALSKHYPPGSGIGAGSGNAAALISWLDKNYDLGAEPELLSIIGADVPFLAGEADIASVGGLGEMVRPVENVSLEGLRCLVAFPAWSSDTARAYAELDKQRDGHISDASKDFEHEAISILERLQAREPVGLLPNDFLTVLLQDHPEYLSAFGSAEKSGALAWGLSGSGSSFFIVFDDYTALNIMENSLVREDWIIKTTELE